jgi:FMN reductase
MTLAIGIAGSLTSPSRSTALVGYVLELLKAKGAETQLIELAQLSGDALLARRKDDALDAALERVTQAQIVVLGTPTYRANYTGQLKAFFDLLPRDALASSVCGLIATGGIPQHALVIDHGLRPLVASLLGLSAAHSAYLTDAELGLFPNGPLPVEVEPQLTALADELFQRAATALPARATSDTTPR